MLPEGFRIEKTPFEKRVWIYRKNGVETSYILAGAGSRACAALLDHLLQFFLYFVFAVTFYYVIFPRLHERGGGFLSGETLLQSLAYGVMIIILFVLNQGYFILFELLWDGETPGKRLLSIKVITENGERTGVREEIIRNLLRMADLIPFFYLLGGVLVLFTPLNRRLGDIAAGTIVVRDIPLSGLPLRVESHQAGLVPSPVGEFNSLLNDPDIARRVAETLKGDEAGMIERVLQMAGRMEVHRGVRYLRQNALKIRQKTGIHGFDFLSDEKFLISVLQIIRDREGEG